MTVNIRPMQQYDIDKVFAIEKSSHLAPWSREILSDCVMVGYDCRVLEAFIGPAKQLIGYIICRRSLNICHILNLCVAGSSQRKGYGQQLLQAVLDSLADSLVDTVLLEVRPSNKAALKLYDKFGFKRDMIKKGYYRDEHGEEDAILLKKTLSLKS